MATFLLTNLKNFYMSSLFLQGNIASWKKKEGDEVVAGDVLCEIETVGLGVAGLRNTSSTCSYSNLV